MERLFHPRKDVWTGSLWDRRAAGSRVDRRGPNNYLAA
jgi:hypothetical protein